MPQRLRCPLNWLAIFCLSVAAPGTAPAQSDPPASAFQQFAGLAPADIVTRTLVADREEAPARLLARAGVAQAEAGPALIALAPLFSARRLQPGQALTLRQDRQADRLLGLAVEPQPGRIITVIRTPTGWHAEETQQAQYRHMVLARGGIRGVVFDDLRAAGLPDPVARELVRTLSQDVDFQREIGPQDRFNILFERFRGADGQLLRDGQALHAEFHLAGRRISLWRHETADGFEWFDEAGRSLRRAFLRTPLDGAEVTSGFGMRSHPVLGFTRMHQGIDFAAPRGTPVFAAADGIVEYVGFAGGYGRTIRLSHAGGTETRYAHLSSATRELKPGVRVRQGEVIGKVGSTGLATGPHLHFEISEAGRLVDPAAVQAMPASRLEGPQLEAFLATRRQLSHQLAQLEPMEEVAMAP